MAFVDKRVQLASNKALTGNALDWLARSDDVDLGPTPGLRGQATEGCYLVITIRSAVTTSNDPGDIVLVELASTVLPSGAGAKYVHWSAGNLDLASALNTGPSAAALAEGWTYVVPLSPKASYFRYLSVLFAVNAVAGVSFTGGAFDAYITTTPPYSSLDLMPQGFSAKV